MCNIISTIKRLGTHSSMAKLTDNFISYFFFLRRTIQIQKRFVKWKYNLSYLLLAITIMPTLLLYWFRTLLVSKGIEHIKSLNTSPRLLENSVQNVKASFALQVEWIKSESRKRCKNEQTGRAEQGFELDKVMCKRQLIMLSAQAWPQAEKQCDM